MRRPIVIGGGVGPMAGALLHQKIIENTTTDGTDQSHHDIIHLSYSRLVPDRTEYLVGTVRENPAEGMAAVIRLAAGAVRAHPAESAIAGVPCNTFHAPEIFEPFKEIVRKEFPFIDVIDMVQACVDHLVESYGTGNPVGVISTTGTRNAGIYSRALAEAGVEILQVPEEQQDALHDVVYNRNWGLKAQSPVTTMAKDRLEYFLTDLVGRGAVAIVLGCTEFPLGVPGNNFLGADLVDPLDTLARELVQKAHIKDS